jgi:hypothetical protein
VRNLTPQELHKKWPKLRPGNHEHRSNATPRYNCVAFVNQDDRHWWEPGKSGGRYYWPPDAIQDWSLDSWIELFTRDGYELSDSADHEPGFEKVAIYIDTRDMSPSHVAKSDGYTWKSKLGGYQDIEHSSLDLLEGDNECEYGVVDRVLRRKIVT